MAKIKGVSEDRLDEIVKRTRGGGGEIVQLLGNGSAYYAPATSAIAMAEAYLGDQKRILPCAAYVEGKYGLDGLYVGVPTVLGAGGCEDVIEIELSDEEKANLKVSTDAVEELLEACKALDASLA
jgi:malate dehydrogenase